MINEITKKLDVREEVKNFRIKTKAPSFDDLIDVAVRAYKDGVLSNVDLRDNGVFLTGLGAIDKNRTDVFQSAVNDIKSLYTETFVIESDSDIERLQDGAEITLSNNEKGVFSVIGELKFITNLKTNNVIMGFNIFWLKGATVTQKRGK